MSFNGDPNKQGNPRIYFTLHKHLLIERFFESTRQKHLGLIHGHRLSFKKYLTKIRVKVSRTISLLHKLQHILSRLPLITKYKAFIRPYIDYREILYDKVFDALFLKKYNFYNIMLV